MRDLLLRISQLFRDLKIFDRGERISRNGGWNNGGIDFLNKVIGCRCSLVYGICLNLCFKALSSILREVIIIKSWKIFYNRGGIIFWDEGGFISGNRFLKWWCVLVQIGWFFGGIIGCLGFLFGCGEHYLFLFFLCYFYHRSNIIWGICFQ